MNRQPSPAPTSRISRFRYDRYGESLAHLEQARQLARRIGNRRIEWFAFERDDLRPDHARPLGEALARLAEIPEICSARNRTSSAHSAECSSCSSTADEVDEARQLLARYDELARSGDVQVARLLPGSPRCGPSRRRQPRGCARCRRAGLRHTGVLGIAAQNVKLGFLHALEAALALGDHTKAKELLESSRRYHSGLRPPLLEAIAHRFRARLAGDDPGADGHFTAAAAQLRALELPFHLAVVQLEHGEWLAQQGRGVDAEPFLAEARETFELLQARPWLQRLDTAQAGTPAETVA